MAIKKRVLERLEGAGDARLSGEVLARELGVSRGAVWKAIKELRDDGYDIEAVTNGGYRLGQNDILSAEGIKARLNGFPAAEVLVYDVLESTNKTAKELAIAGVGHGTLVAAAAQTGGRGRFERAFASPPGGLYMSLVLRPGRIRFENLTTITACAAICVCEVLEELFGLEPKIKWVNDIFVRNQKICGILTEAVTDFETGTLGWIVLGIGINYNTKTDDLPEEVRAVAGSVFPDGAAHLPRNALAAEIAVSILRSCETAGDKEIFDKYRCRMLLIGEKVTVFQGEQTFFATALDINDSGHLIVRADDGELLTLSSGEVSIRA